MLTESAARWLLVLHTAVGTACVAAATHLVVWMRGYLRGRFDRHAGVRKLAAISLALHATAFVAGGVMYPTYKVEVRAAYLENAGAILDDRASHQRALATLADREHVPPPEPSATTGIVKRAANAARWFDIKEHWIALGLFGSAALVLVLFLWNPKRDGTGLAPIALGLAVLVAGTVWFGAIVGVLTASWRAV